MFWMESEESFFPLQLFFLRKCPEVVNVLQNLGNRVLNIVCECLLKIFLSELFLGKATGKLFCGHLSLCMFFLQNVWRPDVLSEQGTMYPWKWRLTCSFILCLACLIPMFPDPTGIDAGTRNRKWDSQHASICFNNENRL